MSLKTSTLRREAAARLVDLLRDKRHELQSTRFLMAGGKLKDVKKIKNLRKDIARILTILSEDKNAIDKT